MGRPRKRRREDVPSEQAAELPSENASASAALPDYSDISLISPDLDDFSGYGHFQAPDDSSNGLLPASFPDAPPADEFGQAISDIE